MTIWKYELTDAYTVIQLPINSKILTVQLQNEKPYVWVLLDEDEMHCETVEFTVIGTGWEIQEDPGTYLGTFQENNGMLVFHVFHRKAK